MTIRLLYKVEFETLEVKAGSRNCIAEYHRYERTFHFCVSPINHALSSLFRIIFPFVAHTYSRIQTSDAQSALKYKHNFNFFNFVWAQTEPEGPIACTNILLSCTKKVIALLTPNHSPQ